MLLNVALKSSIDKHMVDVTTRKPNLIMTYTTSHEFNSTSVANIIFYYTSPSTITSIFIDFFLYFEHRLFSPQIL